jgi:signal transduction histidine kinase
VLKDRLAELARLAEHGAEADDDTARAILIEIETASRRTLEEMRSVVGVLRDDDAAPTAPQPTLVHLESLLLRAKGAGARLEIEGSPRVLPVGVELSAYRVVEHLLSALEDAGDVEVRVRFGDDALDLVVTGPARRRAAAAFGRARERVELHHGTLVASTEGGRAEAVAHLPVLAGA